MGLKRIFRKVEKHIVRPVSTFIPAALGTAVAGPAGGIAAQSATQGAKAWSRDANILKGATTGALQGAAYAALAPMAAEAAGLGEATFAPGSLKSMAQHMSGINRPSLLSQLGVASAPTIGGGLGLFANLGAASGQMGLLDSLLPAGGIGRGLLAKVGMPLVANKLLGASNADRAPENEMEAYGFAEHPSHHVSAGDDDEDTGVYSKRLKTGAALHKRKTPAIALSQVPESEMLLIHPKFLNPRRRKAEPYRKGGYVKVSNSSGVADDVKTKVPSGSYIMDATTVSLTGNGYSDNGAHELEKMGNAALKKWESRVGKGAFVNADVWDNKKEMPVFLSNGEYSYPPEKVAAFGNGDIKKGVKVLDNYRSNLRKQKGIKGILPPKTKPLHNYLGGKVNARSTNY